MYKTLVIKIIGSTFISKMSLEYMRVMVIYVCLFQFGTFETLTCSLIDLNYRRFNKYKLYINMVVTLILIVLSVPLAMSVSSRAIQHHFHFISFIPYVLSI